MEGNSEGEKSHLPYVAVLDTQMLGSDLEVNKNFRAQESLNPDAYVLIVDASGASKASLNKHIQEVTREGTPVFLLSKNPAHETGIQRINYGSQQDAVNSGAIPLKDINFKGTVKVVEAVQTAVKSGMHGDELKAEVAAKFGTPIPPVKK